MAKFLPIIGLLSVAALALAAPTKNTVPNQTLPDQMLPQFPDQTLTIATKSDDKTGGRTIVQLASEDPGLAIFVNLVKKAKLADFLSGAGDVDSQTDGPFTVFAPTNKAFSSLPDGTLAYLMDPRNIKELQSVLKYHVLTSSKQAKDLQMRSYARTLQGSFLALSSSFPGILRVNSVLCEFVDLEASNGVVHIVNQVLLPAKPVSPGPPNPYLPADVTQLLHAKPELSTFVTALVAGGLHDALQRDGPLNRFNSRPGYTVFAPTNQAFAKLPKATLDHLLAPENVRELQDILEYHILGGVALSAGCSLKSDSPHDPSSCDTFDLDTNSFANTLYGRDVNVASGNDGPWPNNTLVVTPDDIFNPKAEFSQVIQTNLGASNGVVHVIDRVLIPLGPCKSQKLIQHSSCTLPILKSIEGSYQHATFVAAVKAAVLARTLDDPATGPYTVFVPSEDAFAKLPEGTLDHLLDPKNIAELQTVLEYHIIAGKALRAGCTKVGRICGPGDLEGDAKKLGFQPATTFWKTLQGQNLIVLEGFQNNATTIIGDSTSVGATIQSVRNSLGDGIGTENHIASNGIWHVIDKVLMPSPMPPRKTIVDLAAATPDLSTLVTALKAGDLVSTLSGKSPFTVFAPTNKAFAALPAGVLANLLKPENKAQLVKVLTYHVASGDVHAKDLHDMEMIKTVEGKAVTARVFGTTILINSAKVTSADNDVSNGVVHIIDAVLMPPMDFLSGEVAPL